MFHSWEHSWSLTYWSWHFNPASLYTREVAWTKQGDSSLSIALSSGSILVAFRVLIALRGRNAFIQLEIRSRYLPSEQSLLLKVLSSSGSFVIWLFGTPGAFFSIGTFFFKDLFSVHWLSQAQWENQTYNLISEIENYRARDKYMSQVSTLLWKLQTRGIFLILTPDSEYRDLHFQLYLPGRESKASDQRSGQKEINQNKASEGAQTSSFPVVFTEWTLAGWLLPECLSLPVHTSVGAWILFHLSKK